MFEHLVPPNDVDSAAPTASLGAPQLGLMLGNTCWLVDMTDVAEVVPVPSIIPVPLTKPWYAGVTNIRGTLVSVVDFSAFVGGAPVAMNERTRLLVIGEKHRLNCALLFERVIGLRHVDRLERNPDDLQRPGWIAARYRDSEGCQWNALAMQTLVTHPDFLQIELSLD
jgi:twitching motility protein PilI